MKFRPIPKGLRPLAQGWIAWEKGAGGPTLGKPSTEPTNPERVAASRSDGQDHCRNPFRFEESCYHQPRVARASQPRAKGLNPFGIRPDGPKDVGNGKEGGEGAEGGRGAGPWVQSASRLGEFSPWARRDEEERGKWSSRILLQWEGNGAALSFCLCCFFRMVPTTLRPRTGIVEHGWRN